MRLKSFRNLLVTLLCVCCFGNAIAEATLTGHTAEIRFLGFLPDGKTLLSGADDSSIRRWDTDTGMAVGFWQQVPKFDSAPSTVILSQSANGRLLARGGKGQGSVDIWDIDRVAMLRTFQAHQRPTVGVALSGDGTLLASFSQSDMRVWDAISGKTRFFVNAPNLYAFLALAVSADGRKVAASSSDKKIALFDVTTATQISQFDGGPGQLLALAFSPDGRYLASGSDGGDDQSLKVWDLTNGLPIAV